MANNDKQMSGNKHTREGKWTLEGDNDIIYDSDDGSDIDVEFEVDSEVEDEVGNISVGEGTAAAIPRSAWRYSRTPKTI